MAFVKGQSGNPGGRPKRGESLTDILRSDGEIKDVEFSGKKISRNHALSRKIWQQALNGHFQSQKYITETLYGKPLQQMVIDHGAGDLVDILTDAHKQREENKEKDAE